MENERLTSIALRLISGVMLILAIGAHPSTYYSILRLIVAGSSFFSGWLMSKKGLTYWAWIFFVIGILFNPIFPIYLDRTTWQIIDILVAVTLFVSLSVNKK